MKEMPSKMKILMYTKKKMKKRWNQMKLVIINENNSLLFI